MKLNSTQQALIDRALRRTWTSQNIGPGHVLAAGKGESKEALKLPSVFAWVKEVHGCGNVFRVEFNQ